MLIKLLTVLLVLSANESLTTTTYQINSRCKRNSNQQCGSPMQSTSLVIGGNNFQRGTWPWMVALMQKVTSPPKLFCGGVLVSFTKVLTGEKL
jgi:secreted trypsin-like serine protease